MWDSQWSIDIDAPIDDVYDYLADFQRHTEWSLGVSEITPVEDGKTGVGAEFQVNEVVPVKFVSYTRITALDRPGHIAWESWDGKTTRVQWSFDLTPRNGGTRVVQRAQLESTSFLGVVLFKLMRKRQMPKENQQSLERIKSNLERPEFARQSLEADVPAS